MRAPSQQMLRYFVVGIVNTAIAYGVFSLLLRLGVHYTWATLIGGVSAMLAGYKFLRKIVFDSASKYSFVKFIILFVSMYFVNIFIQFLVRSFVNPYIAGAIASLFCVLLSYFMNRKFVFESVKPSLIRPGKGE